MSLKNLDQYVIIVAEHVSGKSKGPSGFSRVKPIKYRQAKYAHPIVYYKKFLSDNEEAQSAAKDIAKEMFKLYSMNLGSSHTRVMDYSVILHNVTKDEAQTIYSTMPDIREVNGKMYDHFYEGKDFYAECNNDTLADWFIISRRYNSNRYK